MAHPLIRNWGTLVFQGAIAILFGLLFLFTPLASLLTLVYLFAAFVIADGILALASMFSPERGTSRWLLAVYGIAGIVIGILAFTWPEITALTLLYLIAFWAFIMGIFRIASAIALRREVQGEWLQLLTGIIAVVFGIYVLFAPAGLQALVFVIGIFAIIRGVFLIASGLRLRRAAEMGRGRPPIGGPGPIEEQRPAA